MSKVLKNVLLWYKFELDPTTRAGVMAYSNFNFAMFSGY
jgi:hypothetical protein